MEGLEIVRTVPLEIPEENDDGLPDLSPRIDSWGFMISHANNYKFMLDSFAENVPLPCRSKERYCLDYWSWVAPPGREMAKPKPKEEFGIRPLVNLEPPEALRARKEFLARSRPATPEEACRNKKVEPLPRAKKEKRMLPPLRVTEIPPPPKSSYDLACEENEAREIWKAKFETGEIKDEWKDIPYRWEECSHK